MRYSVDHGPNGEVNAVRVSIKDGNLTITEDHIYISADFRGGFGLATSGETHLTVTLMHPAPVENGMELPKPKR